LLGERTVTFCTEIKRTPACPLPTISNRLKAEPVSGLDLEFAKYLGTNPAYVVNRIVGLISPAA
jgi:hypothetical protein